ncbi:MAG TPA: CARDB domain-containing protein [Gaiellaceae bacterium]|jgi:hypothetical protein|nr:CARDB domain-containing protein [Gaiellaceae bacterium]
MDPNNDDDIEFDFFGDEPATTEAQPTQRVRLPRRGGRGTGGPKRPSGPSRGFTPLLRLLALIAIVVAILVFFGLVLQSCASTSKHDSYQHYMEKVGTIAKSSEDNGGQVGDALTTPGSKVADLVTKLRGIAEQERQNVHAAQDLSPPGPLRSQHLHMIDALQLRVSGVSGLANVFESTATSKSADDAALLVDQADRLLASDVVWDDFFRVPSNSIMKDEGVTGVSAPDSNFVANQDFITEHSMGLVLQRLRGATTGGTPTGIHGTNVVKTVAQPANQELSTTTLNTVTATTDLAFAVTVHNGGDSQEVGIKVTLTIDKNGGAIVKTQTIQVINPGQDKVVTFTDLGGVPFARNTHVDVDVAPVPGEKDATNNKASYPVIFSLG